jgi:hypothetical protein
MMLFREVRRLVLGEKLWEEKGKVVGMSVKSIGPEGVNCEETFAAETKGFGRSPNGTNVGTMDFVQAPDGGFSGSRQGIFMSQDGDTVVWKVYFFGKTEAGKSRTVGIIKFMTTSKKLAWMNDIIAAGESITDTKTMESSDTGYEWK